MSIKKTWQILTSFDKKAIALIGLLTILVFGKSIQGDYLMAWDDNQQVVENEDVKHLNITTIQKYFTTYYVSSYQPLATLSYAMEYAIFGDNASVHHITNLLLHLLNIALVYSLLIKLFKDKWLVVVATVFFAIHPFQTEVVAWISTRSTLMYAAFLLTACNVLASHLRETSNDNISWKTYLLVLLLFVMACFTKSAAIVFPFIFILLAIFLLKKWGKRLTVMILPLFMVSIVFGLVSISSRNSGGDTFNTFYSFYSIKEHILIRIKTLYFYLIEPFYQSKLHIYRAFNTSPDVVTGKLLPDYFLYQGIAACIVLMVLLVVGFKYRKSPLGLSILFGLAWFFINIGLHFNFFAVSVTMVAERYLYLPVIGLGIIAYSFVSWIVTKTKLNPSFAIAAVFVPILLRFGYVSHQQTNHWKNETALYTNDIKYTNYYYSSLQLGRIYHHKKWHEKALTVYNNFIKKNPNEPLIYLYRSLVIADMGDLAYAEKDLYRILDLRFNGDDNPKSQELYGKAFYHLGIIWQQQNPDKSIQYLDSAIIYGHADAVGLKTQLLVGKPKPKSSESNPTSEYDYKSKLTDADRAEEGSVYVIVPKALEAKKYDKALFYIDMMEYVAADSFITYAYRAEALIGLGQANEAKQVLNKAINQKGLSHPKLTSLLNSIE